MENINKLKIEAVIDYLEGIKGQIEYYKEASNYRYYYRRSFNIQRFTDGLKNAGYENIQKFLNLKGTNSHSEFCTNAVMAMEQIEDDLAILEQYKYASVMVNGNFYKFKSMYCSRNKNNDKVLRLATVTCYTKEELNALVASLQRGNFFHYKESIATLKRGYTCQYGRANDYNTGDGYHGVLYQTDNSTEKMVMVFGEENPVDVVFKYIENNIDKTGLMPEWGSYFFNRLSDDGLLNKCEGFNYSNDPSAPKHIVMLSNEVNNELLMQYKMEGLKMGDISLSVADNQELSPDSTFVDLVEKYVIPNIEEEVCDYNIGEEISPVLKTPFYKGKRKCFLYPRQQVMAQGTANAMEYKKNIFLGCGMGVGKTALSATGIIAHAKKHNRLNKTRVIVYAQGHLIPKWKREWTEYLTAQGITPKFYQIEKYTDIKDIPQKPSGFEIFLLPKDRVKRSYLTEFIGIDKFNKEPLMSIGSFMNSLNLEDKDIVKEIVVAKYDEKISLMRLAATRTANKYKLPVVLYKEVLDSNGEVEAYKVCTSSRSIKKGIRLSYDIEVKDLDKFISTLNIDEMKEEINANLNRSSIHHGLVCPECGGFIYDSPYSAFDKEKYRDNLRTSPNSRNDKNTGHRHFIKADGTSLTNFEMQEIRSEKIQYEVTKQKMVNPYQDLEGNAITGEDLIKVKAGKYQGDYKIILRKCSHKLWGAVDQKGYRTVNAASMMKKKFGKNSFDYLIADEAHLFQAQSNQGFTYATLTSVCKKRLMLTGTLTNGKSSSLFYMFYALMPGKMKKAGYRYSDVNLWIEHYGRRKEVEKEYADGETYNKSGNGKTSSTGWNEIPGFSPLLYSNFLADIMISRTIEDMAIPMPPLKYIAHKIEMDDDLRKGYDKLQKEMLAFIKANRGINLGGSYLHNLMAYPDNPIQEPIYALGSMLVSNPTVIDLKDGRLLNKEQKLVDTVKKELLEDRRTLICCTYTGEKGVSKRLVEVLKNQGIKVAELTSSVKLEKREEWIDKKYKEGVEVIVTNPTIIETGLDIYDYPNIYFYEVSYNIKTVRQCEKRSHRIGQTLTCKVFYSYYIKSIQEDCMKLIGSKKKSSLMLEGKFDEDFLSSMSDTVDDGARMLFKMLEGKVTLKEDTLDAFGFEEDTDTTEPLEITTNTIETPTPKATKKAVEQLSLFTLTDDDLEKLSAKVKKKNKLVEGQMSFFSIA